MWEEGKLESITQSIKRLQEVKMWYEKAVK